MKLNIKFIIAFVLALLITSVSVAYLTFSLVREISIENQTKNVANVVNLVDINLTTKNRSIGNTIRTAADSETFRQLFAQPPTSELILTQGSRDYWVRFFQEISSLNRVFLYKNGALVLLSKDPDTEELRASRLAKGQITPELDTALQKVLATDYPIYMGAVNPSASPGQDGAVYVMAGGRSSLSDGAILCEIETDAYYNILPVSLEFLQSQTTFILDQSDTIISSNKSLDQAWAREVSAASTSSPGQFWHTSGKNRYLIQKQYNGLTGWSSYSIINQKNFFPEGSVLKNFLLNFGLLSSLFSILLFGFFTTRITNPLKKLTAAMRKARAGNYSVRMEEVKNDEIGELNLAYNYLLDEISRLIHEVYEEKLALKSAELNALQAQINPHFLYNSLDSVNWMLIDKGDYESSRIIQSIGKILRYSIDSKTAFVPLEEEMKYVENYLIIQKNRFEDQIRYTLSIPEELKDYQVPRLILQPLVENAIKHGLKGSTQVLDLKVYARKGDFTSLIVEDSGSGMTQEQIARALSPADASDQGQHIGLANVSQRISLVYGDGYGIKIQSRPGQGTKVEVQLPKEDTNQ